MTIRVDGDKADSIDTSGNITSTGSLSDATASQIGSSTAYTKIGSWDIVGAETSNIIGSEAYSLFGLGDDSSSTEPMMIFAGSGGGLTALRSPKVRLTGWGASGLGDANQDFTLQAVSGGAATIETSTGDIKLVAAADIDADSNNLKNVEVLSLNVTTAPTPVEGMLYYDSASNKLKFYNGSAWETVTSA